MEGTEREHSNLLANDSSGPDMGRRKDPGNFVLTSGTVTLDQASLRDAIVGRVHGSLSSQRHSGLVSCAAVVLRDRPTLRLRSDRHCRLAFVPAAFSRPLMSRPDQGAASGRCALLHCRRSSDR